MSNYDEDDEEEEQVGLLSSNALDDEDKNGTYNSKARANGKKGKIEPLEIDQVEVIENMSVVEAKDKSQKRGEIDYESSIASGCRGLFIFIVLAISLSLWLWSDQTAKVYVGVQRYHELRIGDVKHWCLDVRIDTVILQILVCIIKPDFLSITGSERINLLYMSKPIDTKASNQPQNVESSSLW